MKVVQFKPDTSVNDDIVAILKDYLGQAKQGAFIGITIIGSRPDGSISHQTSTTNDYITHTGALTIALFRNLMNAPTTEDKQ
jgi:hypothetical protein